ncbi:hypothetical protein D3C87_664150 [compost metagenome]
MNRTNKSTRITIVDEATVEGSKIEFNYAKENGAELPTSVSATAYITGGGMVNVSATSKEEKIGEETKKVLANEPNTSYNSGAKGSQHGSLADQIEEECKIILGITNPEV